MKIKDLIKLTTLSTMYAPFNRAPVVYSSEETIDYILKNKCSIARFGDGELGLMYGRSINFQTYTSKLGERLKGVKTTDKCLVCIPNLFRGALSKSVFTDEDYSFWKKSSFVYGGLWKKSFGKMQPLGDALVSRFYMRLRDKSGVASYVSKLQTLWEDRDIVFVEGKNSRLGVGNDLFANAKSVRRILAPEKNAFEKYDELLSSVKKNCKKDDLIIIALGPTASILAYELSEEYQALDMGHVDIEYEWYKMAVTEKVPVKNKHVNECNSMGDCEEAMLSKQYLKEIIDTIE